MGAWEGWCNIIHVIPCLVGLWGEAFLRGRGPSILLSLAALISMKRQYVASRLVSSAAAAVIP